MKARAIAFMVVSMAAVLSLMVSAALYWPREAFPLVQLAGAVAGWFIGKTGAQIYHGL